MSDTPRTSNLLGKLIEEDGGLDEMNAPFVWVRLTKTLERELNAAKAENEAMREAIKCADRHLGAEGYDNGSLTRSKLQPFLK